MTPAERAGTLPAKYLVMMANELPRHFAAQGLGMPRTPRDVSFLDPEDLIEEVVPFSQSDAYATVSPVLPRMVSAVTTSENRMQPTVRAARAFRRGAEPPSKSSLAIFVVIGLFVGLCAFVAMSIVLPETATAATSTTAIKVSAPVPAVVTPAPIAKPVVTPLVQIAPPAIISAEPSVAISKPAPVRHRAVGTKRPSAKTIALPSNPYTLP